MAECLQLSTSRVFPAAPQTNCYFPAEAAERARTALVRCIERMDGPALLVGASGTGKSLLLAILAETFRSSLSAATLPAGVLRSPRELHQGILYALGLPFRGLDEGELRLSLLQHLEREDRAREGVLLLVDEAQSLNLELLEELRMLMNIVRDGTSCVRLVLAGTPSLEEQLADARLASFDQRVAVRCYLQEMSRAETKSYVQAHLHAAGLDVNLFTPEALDQIFNFSEGLPRLVSQVCDHAILLAKAEGHTTIGAALLQEAWSDLQQLPTVSPSAGASDHDSDDNNEDVIEFGAWRAAEKQELEEGDRTTDFAFEEEFAEEANRLDQGFSIVDGGPDDPIEAIQEQLASIGSEPEPVADADTSHNLGTADVDFSLPDDEWPEVEVVVRDTSPPLTEGFREEEVVADPFGSVATNVQSSWLGKTQPSPASPPAAVDRGSSGEEPAAEVEPLQSVPLMFHVQTELYAPDPVLPDEADFDAPCAASGGAAPQGDPSSPTWQPGLVGGTSPGETGEQRREVQVRRTDTDTAVQPTKKKFKTLFSSLQG